MEVCVVRWLALALVLVACAAGEMVPLRVVTELPNIGYSNLHKLDKKSEDKLLARMKPAKFSGPEHLQSLAGRCFSHRDDKYEFVLCPFSNITQEDIQVYYDAYKGILGVWSDWTIENNRFTAMNMIEGSNCGKGLHRSTKVMMSCGAESELLEVTEPEKCSYLAKFRTPLVCGENAMVVYPRLPEALQQRWNEVEQDKYDGFLTEKGYKKRLEAIFVEGGFRLSPEARKALLFEAGERAENCHKALEAAQHRVGELEEELKEKDKLRTEGN